jgi:hypothetical protein
MLLSERDPTCETVDATSTIEAKGIYIEQAPLSVGTGATASGNGNGAVPDLVVTGATVAAEHARVWRDEAGDCWVQDLPGSTGTWLNGKLLHKGDKARLLPQVRPDYCLRRVTAAAQSNCNIWQPGQDVACLCVGQGAGSFQQCGAARSGAGFPVRMLTSLLLTVVVLLMGHAVCRLLLSLAHTQRQRCSV